MLLLLLLLGLGRRLAKQTGTCSCSDLQLRLLGRVLGVRESAEQASTLLLGLGVCGRVAEQGTGVLGLRSRRAKQRGRLCGLGCHVAKESAASWGLAYYI